MASESPRARVVASADLNDHVTARCREVSDRALSSVMLPRGPVTVRFQLWDTLTASPQGEPGLPVFPRERPDGGQTWGPHATAASLLGDDRVSQPVASQTPSLDTARPAPRSAHARPGWSQGAGLRGPLRAMTPAEQ